MFPTFYFFPFSTFNDTFTRRQILNGTLYLGIYKGGHFFQHITLTTMFRPVDKVSMVIEYNVDHFGNVGRFHGGQVRERSPSLSS